MKFRHHELIIGIIIGAICFSGFSIFANDLYNITPNPYKIIINGSEKHIEGFNINGYSYFKLRDIGEQVGFDVDFREEKIMITNENNILSSDATTTTNYWINADTYIENSIKYYSWNHYESTNMLLNSYIDIIINGEEYVVVLRKKNEENTRSRSDIILLDNIEYKLIKDKIMISEEYFNENILPFDK